LWQGHALEEMQIVSHAGCILFNWMEPSRSVAVLTAKSNCQIFDA